MRLATIAVLFAVTLTTAASSAAALDDPSAGASVTATSPADNNAATAALQSSSVWYRDPIAIALAIVALFALIDLSLMLTAHRQRTGARAYRQPRSEYWRA
ncbi:MAG: hypothetical protein ACT4P6_20290 [Gemmatimonadaceae bacterium]